MANPSDNFPDAPLDADMAVDTPEGFNRKNAALRQRVTAGYGMRIQWTPAGPILRSLPGDPQIAVSVQFGSALSQQGYYGGTMQIGNATSISGSLSLTAGKACIIKNLPDLYLTSPPTWPIPSGQVANGIIIGTSSNSDLPANTTIVQCEAIADLNCNNSGSGS